MLFKVLALLFVFLMTVLSSFPLVDTNAKLKRKDMLSIDGTERDLQWVRNYLKALIMRTHGIYINLGHTIMYLLNKLDKIIRIQII